MYKGIHDRCGYTPSSSVCPHDEAFVTTTLDKQSPPSLQIIGALLTFMYVVFLYQASIPALFSSASKREWAVTEYIILQCHIH